MVAGINYLFGNYQLPTVKFLLKFLGTLHMSQSTDTSISLDIFLIGSTDPLTVLLDMDIE